MLVSILDWIICIPMILQVRILKSSLFFSGPNQLKLSLAGFIRWWPKWLTNIHELCLDCTDLITTVWGWTLTGMVTNQAWTKSAAQSILHTFQASKIIFYFPTFHTWVVFYIPELFSVPKNTFFVSCFRAAYRHLVPRSVYHERCRLKLAAAALCTTGNRHTVRRRHPTHCSNADVSCFSEIIFCGYFYMIFNAPLLLLCSKGQFA